MADNAVLPAEPRVDIGKQAAKRLRKVGSLPAVVYGDKGLAMPCSVNLKALETLLHSFGRNAIVSLEFENGGSVNDTTIIKEVQYHPVWGEILHVDFHRISLTEKIVVEVAVEAIGIPDGVRNDGGILEHMLHSVEVECLPAEIPDHFEVDVTALKIGDSVHVREITSEGGARITTDGDRSVFVVVPPSVKQDDQEEEMEDAMGIEEGEMQEPELIERGKREEEEEGE